MPQIAGCGRRESISPQETGFGVAARFSRTLIVRDIGKKIRHNRALDEKMIEADAAMGGYYCIVTSEQEWGERETTEAHRGLPLISLRR